jgi:hypothetical protein
MTSSHRFSESAFRNYENELYEIQIAWPLVSAFDPARRIVARTRQPISIETYTCRLRDAFHGYIRFNYTSDRLVRTTMERIYQDVAIGQRDGKVVVGPRISLKSVGPVAPVSQISTSSQNDVIEVVNPSERVLHAFCLLLSERLIKQPLLVRLMDPQLLLSVQETGYDIAVTSQDDGSILIM